MKNKFLIALVSLVVISIVSAGMIIPTNDNAKEDAEAPENSPVIGENWALEPNGLMRVDLIHYAKPDKPGKQQPTTTCYKLMGVQWSTPPVSYVINPKNSGLDEGFVKSAISTSAETWDAATVSELFNNVYAVDYTAKYRVQNYKNAITFGKYPAFNVIAITTVWYRPVDNKIVEFDMLFNTRFKWGNAASNPSVMDLQNIATHELGHGVGLADVYDSVCSAVTLYGYSGYGETQKRTLETPDITGLKLLYG